MDLYEFDRIVVDDTRAVVVGTDEAGRGPLAGPVVAAAVQLDLSRSIEGIDDSKRLSPKRREVLYDAITAGADAWAVALATPEEIDRHNILAASLMAMKRALEKLPARWDLALVDGNQPIRDLEAKRQRCIVDGDAKSASIAAASILAKVTRDRIMCQYHQEFPHYDFMAHKGYPTTQHRRLIREHGLCPIHRRSFCERLIVQTTLALNDTFSTEGGQ